MDSRVRPHPDLTTESSRSPTSPEELCMSVYIYVPVFMSEHVHKCAHVYGSQRPKISSFSIF